MFYFVLQEEHMPVNHPFTERPNNEPETSSHHLEGETTKVLGSAPGRNVSVLHGEDENIGYQASSCTNYYSQL